MFRIDSTSILLVSDAFEVEVSMHQLLCERQVEVDQISWIQDVLLVLSSVLPIEAGQPPREAYAILCSHDL